MKFIKKNSEVVRPEFLEECSEIFGMSPLIMEQIIARGNDTVEKIAEFLEPTKKSFNNPFDLSGMTELVARIKKAVMNNERILIFGDYDVDGISATAIMLKLLKNLGSNAKFYLPNRYIDGYGLTNDVIKKIKKEFDPQLIITVDCGISCHDEVEFAKTLGIEIVVTDHHEIPEILPETIVVNAKLPNQKYGFSGLCGTGLAYKIAVAMLGADAEYLLPIATIATIADIVPLTLENRAIVYRGLRSLNDLPLGLKMLFRSLNIDLKKCTASDISFKVSPKINASGRMGDAKDSLKLYFSENPAEIRVFINKIMNHNNNRKDLCTIVENDCGDILARADVSAPSIILASKDWDAGILGIICAKLVTKYNRPVFLFTEADGEMKGSARSIKGVNIHELLSNMSDILESFGGHPIAAGLTIKSENFDQFITRVNDYLLENISPDVFEPRENYDIEIKASDLSPRFINDLKKLEPTGCDNEPIRFFTHTKNFEFAPLKNFYNHCNIKLGDLALVNFNCSSEYDKIKNSEYLNIIYALQFDGFSRGLKGIIRAMDCDQLTLKNLSRTRILPELNALRYIKEDLPATFTSFEPSKETLALNSYFGTAFVVTDEASYKTYIDFVDTTKVCKCDFNNGTENSGVNCLFISPESIEFTRCFKKIIFLSPIADTSYIGKINSISRAEIFVANGKIDRKLFKYMNIYRENFASIYRNLKKSGGSFTSIFDLYAMHKKRLHANYSYRELYSALLVFEELNLIKLKKINDKYVVEFGVSSKVELNNSKIYNALLALKL